MAEAGGDKKRKDGEIEGQMVRIGFVASVIPTY